MLSTGAAQSQPISRAAAAIWSTNRLDDAVTGISATGRTYAMSLLVGQDSTTTFCWPILPTGHLATVWLTACTRCQSVRQFDNGTVPANVVVNSTQAGPLRLCSYSLLHPLAAPRHQLAARPTATRHWPDPHRNNLLPASRHCQQRWSGHVDAAVVTTTSARLATPRSARCRVTCAAALARLTLVGTDCPGPHR
jgi:hypothetical protein